MNITDIPPLRESNDALQHPDVLAQRWADDGYLFFRNVIDPSAIAALRAEYMRRLKDQDLVAAVDAPPVWTGTPSVNPKPIERMDDEHWRKLVSHPSFSTLMSAVLGESPNWIPIVSYRAKVPVQTSSPETFHNRHQDGYFNAGIDFRICWVPLMDIDSSLGGLAIAPGTHKKGPLHNDDAPPTYDIPSSAIADSEWRRSDYRVGDVLMFHNLVAHAALDNVSDKLRLSIDVRAVPASSPQPIIGQVTAFADPLLHVQTTDGSETDVRLNNKTYVRGIGNARLKQDEWTSVLYPGNQVVVAVDGSGSPLVVRSAV
jgi:hypothetical protein